ncbi:MAG: hypothetical protein E6H76_15145, partial [Betaproteobacteria bacterium]
MNKQNQIAGLFTALFVSIAVSACALMQSGAPSAAKAELASTGKVRVALINVANFVAQPATNPPTGMGVDLGKTIAARVGAPLELKLGSFRGSCRGYGGALRCFNEPLPARFRDCSCE